MHANMFRLPLQRSCERIVPATPAGTPPKMRICRYDHDEAWQANMRLFQHFTDVTQGVRRLGAAAVDLCHVALGVVDAYWEYRLKPWDVAAGVRSCPVNGLLSMHTYAAFCCTVPLLL
jgi:fructose-1,6-bisphosphatase/inositol monophosphatase family enzyme